MRSATAAFACSGTATSRSRVMIVTALVSCSKPAPGWVTSLATTRSTRLASSLRRPRATASAVSAAKPTRTGCAAPSRDAPRSARMSRVRVSVSVSGPSDLVIFCAAGVSGRVVGDRGRHHHDVLSGQRLHHRRVHLGGAAHAHHLEAGRHGDGARPEHQRHRGAAPARRLGQRDAHPPARSVADVAHRIDVLVGRPGGDQDATPGEIGDGRRRCRARRRSRSTMSSGSARRPGPTHPQAR